MAKRIRFIWVGKTKKGFWKEAIDYYWKKLTFYYKLEETIVESSKKTTLQEKIKEESQKIVKKIRKEEVCIFLDRSGKSYTTQQFSAKLKEWIENPALYPCFIIGGSFGVTQEVINKANFLFSFSKLTLSYELTRVVLLEQIYRATTIIFNHPYHH